MIQCRICNKFFNHITTLHLMCKHNMNNTEYLNLFPNAQIVSNETKDKKKKAFKNQWKNKDFLVKHSKRMKSQWKNKEYRNKITKALKSVWDNPEFVKNISKGVSKNMLDKWKTKSFRNKMSKVFKKNWKNKDYREMMTKQSSDIFKKLWKDKNFADMVVKRCSDLQIKAWKNPEYRNKMIQIIKDMGGLYVSKEETNFFNNLDKNYPNIFRHSSVDRRCVKDKMGYMNPDVKVIGQKKFIEYNGKFWHTENETSERVKRLNDAGYQVLIIWDYEWKKEPEKCIFRCIEFAKSNIEHKADELPVETDGVKK